MKWGNKILIQGNEIMIWVKEIKKKSYCVCPFRALYYLTADVLDQHFSESKFFWKQNNWIVETIELINRNLLEYRSSHCELLSWSNYPNNKAGTCMDKIVWFFLNNNTGQTRLHHFIKSVSILATCYNK